jgi:hypothetical protein
MNPITNILIATVATITFSVGAKAESLKPLQGASFSAGAQHAAVYFLADATSCKLVVTQADDANYAPVRTEIAVADGVSAQHKLAEGKALQFSCHGGKAMTVNALETVAINR